MNLQQVLALISFMLIIIVLIGVWRQRIARRISRQLADDMATTEIVNWLRGMK